MEMFLMVLCTSFLGMACAVAAFGAATRPEEYGEAVEHQTETVPVQPVQPGRFFIEKVTTPAPQQPTIPIEAFLAQIENHVRLEHAAAESFMDAPTAALLHSRTISSLIQ